MVHWWEVIWLFATAFALAAVGGAFHHMYVLKRRKVAEVAIATGYSGCVGLAMSLIWHRWLANEPATLLGICLLSGLAGIVGVSRLLMFIRKFTDAIEKNDLDK